MDLVSRQGGPRPGDTHPASVGGLDIVPPTLADAAPLAALAARTFRDTYGHFLPAQELAVYERQTFNEQAVREWILDPRVRLRLHRAGGTLRGYFKLRFGKAPASVRSDSPIELERLYLDRPYLGRGTGRRLLCEALALAAAADRCWLRVWAGNTRAIALYERAGFVIVDEGTYRVGTAEERVLILVRYALATRLTTGNALSRPESPSSRSRFAGAPLIQQKIWISGFVRALGKR